MSLKTLREDLCRQESDANGIPDDVLEAIIDLVHLIDRHRPLGPSGKHGNLHTLTCGCSDTQSGDPSARKPMGTAFDEAVDAAADAINEKAHRYMVGQFDLVPYCVCGWKADSAYDVAAFDRHIALLSVTAALPVLVRAEQDVRRGLYDALWAAESERDKLRADLMAAEAAATEAEAKRAAAWQEGYDGGYDDGYDNKNLRPNPYRNGDDDE